MHKPQPIGDPQSPANLKAIRDAEQLVSNELLGAAEARLHGAVYYKFSFQGGRLNAVRSLDVPHAIR